MNQSKIVIYQTQDGKTSIDVKLEQDTVWLTQVQMAELFQKDRTVIGRHINNVYNLDVVISVGYRVKSQRGTQFRIWANSILKEYLIRGIAINDNRLKQLGETIKILKRNTDQLDAKQILTVIEQYTIALDLLDDYDHQCIGKPEGSKATYILN